MNLEAKRVSRIGFHAARSPRLAAIVAMAAAAILVNCGDSSTGSSFNDACEGAYAGKCGGSCSAETPCSSGLHCSAAGTCTAECTPSGNECGTGRKCTTDGSCVDDFGLSGSGGMDLGVGGGSQNGNGSGGNCPDINVSFEKQVPTVVLLIDQSGSMGEKFDNGTRWTVLKDALLNPNTGIVKTLENDVRFGLALYTSKNGNQGGTCPLLTEVNIALGNYAAIQSVYGPANYIDDTPTGASITAVANKLVTVNEPGDKVIVLATDGYPDSCTTPDPQTEEAKQESIQAAQAAFAQDIATYIISVGDEIGDQHLQDVANAGAGLPIGGSQNAPFYKALDQAALKGAFDAIINGVRSCVFTLNGSVDPANASQGEVTLDSQSLGYNDPDGWKLNSPTEIEITGEACDTIKTGDHQLTVNFPCGTVTIPDVE